MRILLDTNVIMDFIIEREPFSDEAEKLIEFCIENDLLCCIAAHTIPNLFYILRKHLSMDERRDILLRICRMLTIICIDSNKLQNALENFDFKDFEDCLQIECAKDFHADFIVTRNVNDFYDSIIPVIKPTEMIIKLSE